MTYSSILLKDAIIQKRLTKHNLSVGTAARQIGISTITLRRLEHCAMPDMETFCKVVTWLETDPGDYFIRTDKPRKTHPRIRM